MKKSKTNYGSVNNNTRVHNSSSLPNFEIQTDTEESDQEFDPVASNYDARNLLGSISSGLNIKISTAPKSSYVIEPIAFIQNLASSIISISAGQFIYHRILNRLLREANGGKGNLSQLLSPQLYNPHPICNQTTDNLTTLLHFNRMRFAFLFLSNINSNNPIF